METKKNTNTTAKQCWILDFAAIAAMAGHVVASDEEILCWFSAVFQKFI
jgi:hypothetical protein